MLLLCFFPLELKFQNWLDHLSERNRTTCGIINKCKAVRCKLILEENNVLVRISCLFKYGNRKLCLMQPIQSGHTPNRVSVYIEYDLALAGNCLPC